MTEDFRDDGDPQGPSYPSAPPYSEATYAPGYAQPGYAGQPYGARPPSNGKGVAAMTLGIIALCSWWIPLLYLVTAVPMSIIAIVLGAQAKNLNQQGLASNPGQSKAGFICGIIAIVLCLANGLIGVLLAVNR